MKTLLKIVGVLLVLVLVVAAAVYIWASVTSSRLRSRTLTAHTVDFPIPFPLPEAEAAGMTADAAATLAKAQAITRGKHLVESRYVCVECHGDNFGGGTMIDAFPIGSLLGSNLTTGAGSRTINYTPADWDRTVRHGILPDGRPAVMPAEDFKNMSDQELSDVIAYIRSMPPVDNTVPASTFGPLGKFLVATGQLTFAADKIEEDTAAHLVYPPATAATAEFGGHVAAICTGCHRENFAGGPIMGGDPSWPPARNLTPHAEGLAGWTFDQFQAAMRKGVRPDGTPLQPPMSFVMPYAQNMQDVELQALWAYLRTLTPQATNK